MKKNTKRKQEIKCDIEYEKDGIAREDIKDRCKTTGSSR